MKILMDTHAFLWFVEGDKRLISFSQGDDRKPLE